MIVAVLVSAFSLAFGAYQNFQARNNHAFIYEQAYKIIGAIQSASIAPSTKAQLTDKALNTLGTPAPVIDLSRSSADVGSSDVCSPTTRAQCAGLATQLATANAVCTKSKGADAACEDIVVFKSQIVGAGCFVCYTQ